MSLLTYQDRVSEISKMAVLCDARGVSGIDKDVIETFLDIAKYIDSSCEGKFARVNVYLLPKLVIDKELRDIKQDTKTLYLFMSGLNVCYDTNNYSTSTNIIEAAEAYTMPRANPDIKDIVKTVGKNIIITSADMLLYNEDNIKSLFVPNVFNEIYKSFNEEETEDVKENRFKKLREALQNQINIEKSSIEQMREDAERARDDYYRSYMEKNAEISRLEHLANDVEQKFNVGTFMSRIKKAESLGKIKKVEVVNFLTEVYIYTDKLYINSMGYRFYIGEFKIQIDLSNAKVTFTNLTTENLRKSTWGPRCHHPHVGENGRACLGEAAEPIMMACKDYRIDILAIVLTTYLESINPDDSAGKHLTEWDIVDNDGKIIDFPAELKPCHNCEDYVTETNKDSFKLCDDCGENFCHNCIDEYETAEDTVWLCSSCREEYEECTTCEKLFKQSELHHCSRCDILVCDDCSTKMSDGSYLCNSCKEKYVEVECSHCHQTLTVLSEDFDENETFVCDSCELRRCEHCDNISDDDLVWIENDKRICRNCYVNTAVCDFCGTRKSLNDLEIQKDKGFTICKGGCE